MEAWAIIILLVGVIAFLAYRHGKKDTEKDFIEGIVKSNEDRKDIRNMSDSDLDDELRDYWE